MVGVFDTGAGLGLVRKWFHPVKRFDGNHTMYNMSVKSALDSPVNIKGKVMIFVQLGNQCERVHSNVVDSLSVMLIISISFINSLSKKFPMKQ